MPRLPVHMVKREREGYAPVYYWRRIVLDRNGKPRNQCRALGSDYEKALNQHAELEASPPPVDPPEPEPAPEPVLTVEAFSRRWLDEYAATQRTPRGRAQAEQRFRDFLWPMLGAKPLAELNAADFRWLNAELAKARPAVEVPGRKRRSGGVGLVSRHHLFADIRTMLGYAVEAGELDRLPWGKKVKPKKPKGVPNPLSDVELAWAIRVAPGPWRPVFALTAATGLRWGEVRAITWKDVREKPYPHLLVSKSHDGPTKSRKAREVPLGSEALAVLASLEAPTDRAARVFDWLPEVTAWIVRHVKRKSPVKGFTFHRLRHTFGCRFIERGGRLEALQHILGHASITQTEGYAKLSSAAVAAEMARVDVAIHVATAPAEATAELAEALTR